MKKFIAGALAISMIAGMVCLPVSAEAYDDITTDLLTTDGEDINASATTAEAFLKSGTDLKNVKVYDGSSSTGFKVNGRTYYTGIDFAYDASITFNTKNVKKLNFNLAHIDNTRFGNMKLTILYDGEEYKTIDLTPNMDLLNVRLDVTNADKVTFKTNYGSQDYALIDMTVDGVKTKKGYTSPTYKTTDDLLKGLYNTGDLTIYDGSKKLGFKMNGRTYYYGAVLGLEGAFSLNTDNISSLSFDLAQVDNTGSGSCKISVYYDDELRDTIECSFNKPIQTIKYTDLKDVHNVRIVKSISSTSYGLGNITFNSVKPAKSYTKPTYTDALDLMDNKYNFADVEVYDGSKKLGFNMNGKNYKQGLVLGSDGRLAFNTENIGTLTFTLGLVDSDTKTIFNSDYTIYFDDAEYEKISFKSGDKPQTVTYDVSNVKNVYISRSWSSLKLALADIKISKSAPKATFMKGDVNLDKKVDVTDIAMVASHIKAIKALSGNGLLAADVNSDKKVDVTDIAMIASHIKGIKALK